LLAFLTRTELLQLAADYKHSGLTAKPKDEIIDAIVGSSRPSESEVLEYFSRAQLKSACEELGLETSGREKQVLIDRLLSRADDDDSGDSPDEQRSSRHARPRPGELPIDDYRHEDVTRKNIPPAKLAAEGLVPKVPPVQYAYSPRRPPALRFDSTGGTDGYFELLDQAKLRPLTEVEAQNLRDALAVHEPWLEWAGKQEEGHAIAIDPVALHIHERVSTQAVLRVAARENVERSLFGDPEQEYHDAVQFYRHEIDWTNRLILGDGLQVMASLARREELAGRVQMIYIDPPYGVKFGSNFQSQVGHRDVSDRERDLTREPETVKAYRDTWHLGVHSYLAYLRARLVVARELLSDSGSVFVQIGDDQVHRVRSLLDEVFGAENACQIIPFRKKLMPLGATLLEGMCDYLLWYARDRERVKFRHLYKKSVPRFTSRWTEVEESTGARRKVTSSEAPDLSRLPDGARVYRLVSQRAPSFSEANVYSFTFRGETLSPPRGGCWVTSEPNMRRLAEAERLQREGDNLSYVLFHADFPYSKLTNMWDDTSPVQAKRYVVQTSEAVVERCMLMTTDPGDLVLDPTCGSGTTAFVSESLGRRWITIDTSRVAIALARQRLLTGQFDFYRLRPVDTKDRDANPRGQWLRDPLGEVEGLVTIAGASVPKITLRSIVQNVNLDAIVEKHAPMLDEKLRECNSALTRVDRETRRALATKLHQKERTEGRRSVTDADRRRWSLPDRGTEWHHWDIPFDTDLEWPKDLRDAVEDYRRVWRAKMNEIDASIAANAEQEELVDQPDVVRGVLRVSGPFTVEAVQPAETSLGLIEEASEEPDFGGAPPDLGERFSIGQVESAVQNVQAYLAQMIRLLRTDGVRFPNNRQMQFTRLDGLSDASGLHAEGRWVEKSGTDNDPEGRATVAVAFGPQYGPVTAPQVAAVIRAANRRGYDNLVIAGFSFDGAAQADIEESQHPKLHIDMAHIRPDVNPGMEGLLKEQPNSQLFSVFGQPRSHVTKLKDGTFTVTMEGVDIYDPVSNTLSQSGATKIAAWFLDGDYDGATFCITQAFFPNRDAWEKIARALKTSDAVDESVFDRLAGTISLPFPAAKHRRAAVKVIDPRGNEVMQVHRLE
jgi:adenine-specific DNA-methyltransferase